MPNVAFGAGRKDCKTISKTTRPHAFAIATQKKGLENVTLGGPGGSLDSEHSLKGRNCSGKACRRV